MSKDFFQETPAKEGERLDERGRGRERELSEDTLGLSVDLREAGER